MKFKRIAIIRQFVKKDAGEDEQEAISQALEVQESLNSLGFKTEIIEVGLNFELALKEIHQFKVDAVFNLLESIDGSSRLHHLFPAVLAYHNIPFTGCSHEALGLTSNKIAAKSIMLDKKIPTANYTLCSDYLNLLFPPPYIVKPIFEHASVDLFATSVCKNRHEVHSYVQKIPEEKRKLFFIEQFIDGREFNISVIGTSNISPKILPHAEIDFSKFESDKPKIVDYHAKWDKDSFEYHNTNRSFKIKEEDQRLINELSHITANCWNIFELSGYARIDFRVNVRPYVLEINANPCISKDAGFAAAAAQSGLSYTETIEQIVENIKC